MDRRNVTGPHGIVHQGLLNSYTGDLIDLACTAGRRAVVQPYGKFDPAALTEDPLSCAGCLAAVNGTEPHPADVAGACADAVLADVDGRGYLPSLDNEGMRLAFERLALSAGELRPVFERLARGVYDPQDGYRTQPLYALVREHLADRLTERALEAPAEGTPRVLVEYTRFTGGTVQAPVGAGDRLMRDGTASGVWYVATVVSVEPAGVTVKDDDGWTTLWDLDGFHRWFTKLDRAPHPAAV